MPVVMRMNENGMVDPVTKTVRLPSYLGPKPPDRNDMLRKAAIASVPLLFMSISSMPTQAAPVTLSDGGNATALIDPTTSNGLYSLIVGGNQQVENQWFYYRTGTSGALSSIDTISAPSISFIGSNGVSLTYSDSQLKVKVIYTLNSADPNGASLSEQITINNLSGTTLPISFAQFNHFTLDGDTTHDVLSITGGNTATQTLTDGDVTSLETVSTPPADYFETALSPAILNEMTTVGFVHLADSGTGTVSAGPGDVTYAFQWSPTLTASGDGSSYQISKSRTIADVPEPTMTVSLVSGIAIYFARRPRRRNAATK